MKQGGLDLRELTRKWFLFLGMVRRQAAVLDGDIRWVRTRLDDLLGEIERLARADARLEVLYNEIKPILVYLADEVLLTSGWAGEAEWGENLLETTHFRTQHAGEDFFRRLEEAMRAERPEILEIYFKALCLGFKGKYLKQRETLDRLRKDLYRRLPAEKLTSARLCPEAYESTDARQFQKLPVVAVAWVVVVLVVFVVAAYFAADRLFEGHLGDLDQAASKYLDRGTGEGR